MNLTLYNHFSLPHDQNQPSKQDSIPLLNSYYLILTPYSSSPQPIRIPHQLLIPPYKPVRQQIANHGNARKPETQSVLTPLEAFDKLVGEDDGGCNGACHKQ